MEHLVHFKTGSAQRERCFSWPDLEYLKFWMVKDGRKKFTHRYPIGAPPHNVPLLNNSNGTHTGRTADVRSPVNITERTKWEQDNAALFSMLFLITGPAGSLMFKSESNLGKRANGQEAWQALLVKYENNSTQRRRTLMRKLDNSKMEDGQDPDVFFVQV